ncbi:MAG: hypothetical protein M2R45_01923 [Verrucomicrobia subdivision 3 bacterium]|nr:hypothetical protein [Limisphaerales bacterium]MCS1416210.1 hypothetical protein [Limisphaerales bacterium]
MNSRARLRHYFTHYETLGGVQSILDTHLKLDPQNGLSSSLLAFFEPAGQSSSNPAVTGLGLSGRDTIRSARRKFRQHEQTQHNVRIYHDLWGLAFLGEYDTQSRRRIGAVHSTWPHLSYQLRQLTGSLDGIFTDSQAIAARVRSQYPRLEPLRIKHLPVPARIAPQQHLRKHPPLANRRLLIGFVGRLDYAQKRVDRFPHLLEQLNTAKIDCELQFLGDGNASASLPSKFPANAPVTFFGRKAGDDYWKIMSKWDFVVYTSDHEGSPLALIECMSVGCLPIFPSIGSGGDLLVESLDPQLLYAPEDWHQVTNTIKDWQLKPAPEYTAAREKSREISLGHSPKSYHKHFIEFLDSVLELPKVSRNFSPKRPFLLSDHLPFGLLHRYHPKGFFRANPLQN